MESNKTFYLMVRGQRVEVSEEVYRAYVRPIRKEQRKQKRDARCIILKEWNGRKEYVRCKADCSKCKKVQENPELKRSVVSLDEMKEEGIEMEDTRMNTEEQVVKHMEQVQLQSALSLLNESEQRLVELIYFEGMSLRQVSSIYGVDHTTISRRISKILAKIKNFLGNF